MKIGGPKQLDQLAAEFQKSAGKQRKTVSSLLWQCRSVSANGRS